MRDKSREYGTLLDKYPTAIMQTMLMRTHALSKADSLLVIPLKERKIQSDLK